MMLGKVINAMYQMTMRNFLRKIHLSLMIWLYEFY